jgi:hypothetical protein
MRYFPKPNRIGPFTRNTLAISFLFATFLAAVAPAGENVWVSHGPTDAAWVTDIAIADSVAYAATVNGVFRSLDRGETWQQSGFEAAWIDQVVAQPGAPVVPGSRHSTPRHSTVRGTGARAGHPFRDFRRS